MTLVRFIRGPWHEQVRDVDPLPEKKIIRPDPKAGACYVVLRSRLTSSDTADLEALWVDAPQGWMT